MIKNFVSTLVVLVSSTAVLLAQPSDPVLFTVDESPVHVSEFDYIYGKTNQNSADYSEESLREYLDLYIKFKLKVHRARDMQLDTVEALKRELDGYRRQLANSYLIDKEVTEKLVQEAHEHMQQDVDISHIFVNCSKNANPPDTLKAYQRVANWKKLIEEGTITFEKLAVDSSQDQSAAENEGNLGFVTAMLPNGYYALEEAAYNGKPGGVYGPLRSHSGYHLIRVNAFRPARGEVEVAQILFRKEKDEAKNPAIRARVDSVYNALVNNIMDWGDACTLYSDDKVTSTKKGYLGFFGINRYQRNFEDAAFALEKDGDISEPVETTIGWHIIKRLSRRPVQSLDVMRRALTQRVKRDARSELAKQSMIDRIKKEGNFKDYPQELDAWAARQVDTVFLTYRWKPDNSRPQDVLMTLGNNKYTVSDFEEFCARSSRQRMRGSGNPLREVIDELYASWTDDVAMQYEESQLDKKYPEFKSLMREYEEGILLFDATKQLVWDKANTDTIGLQQFFDTELKGKYTWDERARTTLYTLKTTDPALIAKVRKQAAKRPAEKVVAKFNKKKDVLTAIEQLHEKGKNKSLGDLWTAGAMTETKTDETTQTASFVKIEEMLPPMPKMLSEARGYAVADYQDYLEQQWVKELREMYEVNVNEEVLKSLIR